jgi:hypothetical protein
MQIVRFCTLCSYSLTAAIESSAGTVTDFVEEIAAAATSGRSGHPIDLRKGQ